MEKNLDLQQIIDESTIDTFKHNLKIALNTIVPSNQQSAIYLQIALNLYQQEQFDYAMKTWQLGIETVTLDCDNKQQFELFKQYGLALNSYKGDYNGAIFYLQKAQSLLDKNQTVSEDNLEIIFGISRAYFNLNQLSKAENIAKKALKIALVLDNFNQIRAYLNLGDIALEENKLTKAKDFYQIALKQAQSKEEIVLKAVLLMNIGVLYKKQFLYDDALMHYNQAKEIYEKIEFNYELSELYLNIGIVLAKKMHFDDAILLIKSANEYFINIGHTHNILVSYINLGRVEQDRANYKKSIEYFDKGLKMCENDHNFLSSYTLLLYLKGNSLYDLKKIKTAEILYQKALILATKNKDISQAASIQNALAAIESHNNQFVKALAIYQDNLEIFTQLNDIEELIATYTNLALLYDDMGYFQQSHQTYQKALVLLAPYNLEYLAISLQINQAGLFQNFLQYNKAIKQYNDILSKLEYMDNDYFLIKVYHNMANLLEITSRFKEAIKYTHLSITLKKSIGDENLASAFGILARANEGLKNTKKAEKYYQLAFKKSENSYHKYGSYINYALFLINTQSDYKNAIIYLTQAKKYFERENAIEPLIAIHDNFAKVFHQQNLLQKAIFHYKKSLQLGENILLDRISIEALHLTHRKNFLHTYQNLIELFLQNKEINDAYIYLVKFKSQTFRKIFASKYFQSNKIPISLLEQEKELLTQLSHNNIVNFGLLIDHNKKIKIQLNLLYEEIKKYDEAYVFMKLDGILTIDKIKKFF